MTKFAAEIEYAYQHFMTLVEGTHPRTLSKDHFEHVAGILANAVERAVEAKYNSGDRTPWTKDTEAKYMNALNAVKADLGMQYARGTGLFGGGGGSSGPMYTIVRGSFGGLNVSSTTEATLNGT